MEKIVQTKLYLLENLGGRPIQLSQFSDGFFIKKLIRANTEKEARKIANKNVRDESWIWEDETKVSIEIVGNDGEVGELLNVSIDNY